MQEAGYYNIGFTTASTGGQGAERAVGKHATPRDAFMRSAADQVGDQRPDGRQHTAGLFVYWFIVLFGE